MGVRNAQVFRLRPAQHDKAEELLLYALARPTGLAEIALAAGGHEGADRAVARLEVRDAAPCLDDLADVLVPHRPPGRGDIHAAVVGVDIGAAYPGRCHLEDDVVRLLDLRVGDVLDNDFERALERGGFHGGDLLESYCRVLSAGCRVRC